MSDAHSTRPTLWKPGQSANPAGKPPGTALTTILESRCAAIETAHLQCRIV